MNRSIYERVCEDPEALVELLIAVYYAGITHGEEGVAPVDCWDHAERALVSPGLDVQDFVAEYIE